MELKELQRRLENQEAKVKKIEKKIEKLSVGSRVELVEKLAKLPYVEFKKFEDSLDYNEIELRRAFIDLKSTLQTRDKYATAIAIKEAFYKEEKIKVIEDFLESWKQSAYEWYLKNAEKYFELKEHEQEEEKKYLKQFEDRITSYFWEREITRIFRSKYYSEISQLTKDLVISFYDKKIDLERLKNFLEEEKIEKYKSLIARVNKVVGEIVDANQLSVAKNGEINGIIKGKNGDAFVETITAGGYNIQCFHFRVLVKKL